MTTLGKLVCGQSDHAGNARVVLDQLKDTIDKFAARGLRYLAEDFSEDAQCYGAFCARVVLENACAALVGRLDIFRLLYLREFQAQANYDYGLASNSGFKWTGDVIAKEQNSDMWGINHDATKVSRALFSQYTDHLHWSPAFIRTLDKIAETEHPPGVFDQIHSLAAGDFLGRIKGESKQLYSKLSKGVHWEFFLSTMVMDEATLKTAIRDCFELMSNLGLVSHFIPAAYHCLPADEAIEIYADFRRTLP